MSKPQMISMTLVVAMLACAIMLLQACGSKKQATPARMAMPPSPLPATYPALEHQPVRGVAAVAVSRPGQLPAFAPEELGRFAETHPVPRLMMTGPPHVTKLDCAQTAKTVGSLLRGKRTGLSDSTPVCYVELQGSFTVSGPRSAGKNRSVSTAFETAFEVFDSKTGNLLLSGGFTRPAPAAQ
jgi:hypothetical protein